MYTFLKPIQVRERLVERQLRIFTSADLEVLCNVSRQQAKYFLETQTKQGLFERLKNGLYALKTDIPAEQEIANALYRPSYISFEYALAYWKLIPEMPYAVTSATTMPTRDFVVAQKSFSYYTIQRAAYTGYILCHVSTISEKYNNVHFSETDNDPSATFLIAEPEKALADFLYFVALGKKMPNDRLSINTTQIDAQKLLGYGRLYHRKSLLELIQRTLDAHV